LCTIPTPDAIDEKGRLRFTSFTRAFHGKKLPLFAQQIWKNDDPMVINIQGSIVQKDGALPPNLQHYMDDKRLGKAYTEQVLLEIACALAALHHRQTESGSRLYHGFLLPRSVYFQFDGNSTLNKIVIADMGMAFTFGPEVICDRLDRLLAGKLPVDKFVGNELIDQLAMLAPEQKDLTRCHKVGPSADFYAFAALAVLMFTKSPFRGKENIDWKAIPIQWHPFLKACLNEQPAERPEDFDELKDWLTQPDLALTVRQTAGQEITTTDVEAAQEEVYDLEELASILEKVQGTKKKEAVREVSPQSVSESTDKQADEQPNKKTGQRPLGLEALRKGEWKAAQNALERAYASNCDDPKVCVSLAIALYEQGDLSNAERYYNEAKQKDPTTAKCFRNHIAFRV
jgi:hypothetical protein